MEIINVEQIKGDFYGGFPYKVAWSFNGESEPSKLTVEVVNEQGDYSKPDLNFSSAVSISIGSFDFDGYLVGYSLNATADQKTLTLEYVDQSVLLDKYWVGLKDVHVEDAANVIIVGKQYHPCDINMDSSLDYTEEETRLIDPCDPCPFSPVDKYKEACDPRTKDIETFETYYTFSELISKISSRLGDLNIDYDASGLYMYKAQHIGNLRSVLSSWCSDLGLSFFWDPLQKKLIFQSRSAFADTNPVSYETIKDNPRAVEISYKENILGTFSQGFMGRFERPGKFSEYPCRQDTWKMLRPITLGDLFLPDPNPSGSRYDGEISARSVAVALSYYSSSLRDLFLWFIHYGILKATDADNYASDNEDNNNNDDNDDDNDDNDDENKDTDTGETGNKRKAITAQNKGSTSKGSGKGNSFEATVNSLDPGLFDFSTNDDCGSIDNLKTKGKSTNDPNILSHFGGMKIRAVYHINSDNPINKSNFYKCRNNMPRELVEIYKGKEGTATDPKFYFFVAECSEEGYDESVAADRNLANSFLGKYYFNKFRTIVTGASDDKSECDIQGPSEDGNGRWFKAKEGIENIEIFKYGHDENSMIDSLKVSVKKDIEENNKIEDQRLKNSGSNKNPEDYVANSFILYSRNGPKWSPERSFADKWYGGSYAWANQQIPHKYANSDGRPDILYTLFPEAKWNENIKLFMVRELPDLKIDIAKEDHKSEITGGNKIRIEENEFGDQFSINEGPWGLRSTECYTIDLNGLIKIFVPPGSFGEELAGYEDECETAPSYSLLSDELYTPVTSSYSGPGYRVFASCSSEFPKMIVKFKHNMKIDAPDTSLVRKVDYVDYQLAEDNIAIFGDACVPDRNLLTDYLSDLGSTSEYSYSKPLFDINFKLAGVIPEIWSVDQGLSNLSVDITENGVFTTYVLSTKIIQPPSTSYMEQNLRFNRKIAFGNKLGTMTSVRVKTIRH